MCEKSSVRKQIAFLKLLFAIPNSRRSKLLKECKRPQVDAISEIIVNFLRRNLTRDVNIIKKLEPYKDLVRKLALKRPSISSKKKILASKRGAGILSILLPIVSSLFLK